MTRSAERAAPGSRLLLLAALLLGIVAMHTLGHPSASHAMEDVSAAHSVASAGPPGPAADGGAHHNPVSAPTAPNREQVHRTAVEPAHEPARAPALEAGLETGLEPAQAAGTRWPGTGMDPMTVCSAVLAGLVLLYLGAGPAGSRDTAPLGGAARIPGRSGGPDPPSPRELLTRLAVLRV
ncbi:hypothetical protein PV721_17705 [Streptomyces sp. MB09-01]|uniref:hypothetical protein n=1 Tax=Streptomyces sp. MB09-01 TaxID=3028666 RepID=UPI0029B980C7|nr:hypothetical protein [Streptomyces sp. MB09-01]MDX3536175.1 hypothetical protein [Streptomyces sp. MB09-01]